MVKFKASVKPVYILLGIISVAFLATSHSSPINACDAYPKDTRAHWDCRDYGVHAKVPYKAGFKTYTCRDARNDVSTLYVQEIDGSYLVRDSLFAPWETPGFKLFFGFDKMETGWTDERTGKWITRSVCEFAN